ncbi:hypothetical protein D9Q98_000931 [Chlorella vulgaris]|uniref:riboflavin kinase n=1 Tax=Chlorella vulgaris TaxID=3077 RepID=A0A9D4Z1N0_CHLVU|nr:hypothetical protein D9Q98_000931 [Chlorella vulgaris]
MSSDGCTPSERKTSAVIWDLDGTVLDTETLVLEVVHHVVQSHGKVLSPEAATLALGMRPIEAWQAVASTLNITGQSPQDLYEQAEPLLQDRWHEAPLLPGVARLVAHLQQHGVPLALATSTPRATLNRKLHQRADMQAAFKVACCGDEVVNGKPAPDCFLQLAQRLGLPPTECLVIEDSPAGVAAATAAGMRVVAVPSMLSNGKPCDLYDKPVPDRCSGCISLLPSLLDFRPEQYGLPAFTDTIQGTVPLHPPLQIAGTVVKGFGRGSKELGIPTANVDAGDLRTTLAEAVTGIFAGWASVNGQVYKTACSIGWNPVFGNKDKTVEPWLLHTFDADFYGAEIRLSLVAYIRPEANFESLEALVARIHADADVTRQALESEAYVKHRDDPFLLPPPPQP